MLKARPLLRPTARQTLPITPYLALYLSPRLSHSPLSLRPLLASRSFGTSFPRFSPTPPSKEVVPASSSEKALAKDAPKKGTRMQRIWATVKKEALHYWHGTKLLGKEIRISARIQGRLLAGKKLTRREHRQVRFFPLVWGWGGGELMSVWWCSLSGRRRTSYASSRSRSSWSSRSWSSSYPSHSSCSPTCCHPLLPTRSKKCVNLSSPARRRALLTPRGQDEKKRKLLKVRLEMAKFLQETIRETGIKSPDKIKESEDFKEFFRKVRFLSLLSRSPNSANPERQVRSTGESPTTDEVVQVSRLFENDLTLDNLSRPQLVSMCRSVLSFPFLLQPTDAYEPAT